MLLFDVCMDLKSVFVLQVYQRNFNFLYFHPAVFLIRINICY
jgi:hypothetical protein